MPSHTEQDNTDEQEQFCVITGCIARNLLAKPTYSGRPTTREQLYEMTIPYAKIMSSRLKGQPLLAEHEGEKIGEILHAWVNNKNEWFMEAMIDRNCRSGNDMIKAMLNQNSPWPCQMAELSLSHQGMNPIEISMVMEGARPGSTIEGVSLVDLKTLDALKSQEYIVEDEEVPSYIPTDTPIVCASASKMSSYTAIRNSPPPVTYTQSENAPTEAKPILDGIRTMQEQQQRQPTAEDVATKRASLIKQLQDLDVNRVTPQDQFNNVLTKLGQPGQADDPNNTGNIHTMHGNPMEDSLVSLAGLFQTNILNKDQMQTGQTKILELAQSARKQRDDIAQKENDLKLKDSKIAELEAKVKHHESDMSRQKSQTAAMIKKLLLRSSPPMNEKENNVLNDFQNAYTSGNTDEAMKTLQPALIRASAFIDATDSLQSSDMDMQTPYQQPNIMQAVQNIMSHSSQQPTIRASAGLKRSYDQVTTAPPEAGASSSYQMWENPAVPIHPVLAAMCSGVERKGAYGDTVTPSQMYGGNPYKRTSTQFK